VVTSGTVNVTGGSASGTGRVGNDKPRDCSPWVLWVAAFVAALVLYVATLAPDLCWQDAGYFQYEVARLNFCQPGQVVVVHPWFLIAARVLWWPTLWNYAYAANLCSAIGTAIAAANAVLLIWLMTRAVWPVVVGGISFALGHAVWSHATSAEVYGWAAAFLSAECLCFWAWRTQGRARWLVLLFFLNGVAISNHLMAAISLAFFGGWALVAAIRGRLSWWILPVCAAAWLLGGTPYGMVVGLEYARTRDVWATVRSATVGTWGSKVANLSNLAHLFKMSFLYMGLNYPTPSAFAGIVGVFALVRRRQAFAWAILLLGGIYLFWAARYNVADQYTFFIPFYVFGSVFIGVGASWILARFGRRYRWLLLALAVLPVGVYAVLPEVARRSGLTFFQRMIPYRDPYTHFLRPWKMGDYGPRRFAEEVFQALPPDAIILADSTSSRPLKCLRDIEGRRQDVLIAADDMVGDAVAIRLWGAGENPLSSPLTFGRRVFVVTPHRDYAPKWVLEWPWVEPFGLIYEVEREPPGKRS